jgi:hypothetical protein
MPPEPSRPATRTKNADAHPGHQVQGPKRKRRTKAEMEADRKREEEAKKAQEKKKLEGLKKIAEIEDKIEEQDADDTTPRPRRKTAPLRRTSTHAFIPLYNDDSDEPPTEGPKSPNPSDGPGFDHEYLDGEKTDTEDDDDKPAKKKAKELKAKEPKLKARDTIIAVRNELASINVTEGERGGKGAEGMRQVDKDSHGKKAHARLVMHH